MLFKGILLRRTIVSLLTRIMKLFESKSLDSPRCHPALDAGSSLDSRLRGNDIKPNFITLN
jgi:hypothetical protein